MVETAGLLSSCLSYQNGPACKRLDEIHRYYGQGIDLKIYKT